MPINWIKNISLVLLVFGLQGCSGGLMVKSSKSAVSQGSNDGMATVVFMRTSFVAGAVGVEIFEINNGELEFVGALPAGSKISHKTSPGKKVYMAYGKAADFMIADVVGDKTYYVIVRPNWGSGGFAPTPVRGDDSTDYNMSSSEFLEWKNGTTLLEKGAKAEQWFSANKEEYQNIYKEYWEKFQQKTDEQKEQRTLMPSDGI